MYNTHTLISKKYLYKVHVHKNILLQEIQNKSIVLYRYIFLFRKDNLSVISKF